MASIYHLNYPSNWFEGNLTTSLEKDPLLDAFISSFSDPLLARCRSRPHQRPSAFWGWGAADHPDHHDPGQPHEPTPGPSDESLKNPDMDAKQSSEGRTENEMRYRCGKGKHPARGHDGMGEGPAGKGRHSPHRPHDFHNSGLSGAGRNRSPFGGWGAHHGSQPFGAPALDFLRNIAEHHKAHFDTPTPEGVDFVPAIDVFDTPDKYIVHVSLPGAKKDDLSIDYDFEESVLRLAGVVYRPGLNEDLHQSLAVEERAREVGVFEREVRFGTRGAPVVVAVDEITAKLEDGVLNVTVPKVIAEQRPKKKVFIQENVLKDDNMRASVTVTPDESEESDGEEMGQEYVKVPV